MHFAGIQQTVSQINWDNPQQALLALTASIELHMGGTSGAVSNIVVSSSCWL